MDNPVAFFLSLITLLGIPGPTNTLLATSGSTVGLYRSLVLLSGELGGYSISILVIRLLIAPVITNTWLVGSALRVAAAIYLIGISVQLWRTTLQAGVGAAVVTLRQVFVTTLTNPKAAVIALIIIPVGARNVTDYLFCVALIIPFMGAAWIAAGSLIYRRRGWRGSAAIPRVASIVLAIFSAGLIASVLAI